MGSGFFESLAHFDLVTSSSVFPDLPSRKGLKWGIRNLD